MLEGDREISEADNQEKFHGLGREGNKRKDTSGIHKEPGQGSVKFWEGSHVRRDEATEGLHDIEKVIMGRKASKKHKSKWGRRPQRDSAGLIEGMCRELKEDTERRNN